MPASSGAPAERPRGQDPPRRPDWRLYAAIFVISGAALLLELTLTRLFDVILWTNLANFIVSSAIFGLGLGGIAIMLRPMPTTPTARILAIGSALFAIAVLLLIPVLTLLPFDLNDVPTHPIAQALYFSTLYVCLLAPFFAVGIVISTLLTRYAERVHRLYFWDLVGAGIGSLAIIRLPTLLGPVATLILVAAAGALVATLVSDRATAARRLAGAAAAALIVVAVGFAGRLDLPIHVLKGDLKLGDADQRVEFSRWDPVAKIDILRQREPFVRRIAYDGGSQTSFFYRFDGDFHQARAHYFDTMDGRTRYNNGRYVALAYWLKRDTPMRVLDIGSAGGQEVLAALIFGAAHVDAVEMVCTVINLARGSYAKFTGNVYNDPRVRPVCDEGRSFLRHTDQRYDVIQIHSNHTTSSVAQGAGAMEPIYLQTVEAYREYLSHLTDDGILQINYYVYPRMITTAARAWHDLFPGRDFRDHVVIEGSGWSEFMMPTFLVKRSAWAKDDIASIRRFVSKQFADDPLRDYGILYAPGEPEAANVPAEFFHVPLSRSLEDRLPYLVFPPTDSQPFFRDLRKHLHPLDPDTAGYVPSSTARFINASLLGFIPRDRIHLYLLGGLSIAMSAVFVWLPLTWMQRHKVHSGSALPTIVYFGCLGAGFIIIEIVLISKFMVLIGFPIYAMATVLCTILVAAGIGSRVSGWISRRWEARTVWVFPCLALLLGALIVVFPLARDLALGLDQRARIILSAALLLPLGVCLGIPFPLGITALQATAPRLIPWAWGINGFMTVVGSLLAAICSIRMGFDYALLVAAAIYLVAMLAWPSLRSASR
jgi:spermidine synthase